MKKLNDNNWQCFVIHVPIDNGKLSLVALPDYESILVNDVFYYMDRNYPWDYEYQEILGETIKVKKNPKRNQNMFLPVIGLKINLYSSTAVSRDGKIKIVKRADKNDK